MLSQFVSTHEARARLVGKARGQPPADEGAPDGGETSSLRPRRGTKVASKMSELPSAQADANLRRGRLRRGLDLSKSSRSRRGVRVTSMSASGFGLFDPALEKDSCGVGFIADIKGRKSHKIVEDALTILVNLEHRGAVGADPRAGDGAGILVQMPHKFFAKKAAELGFTLPAPGQYAVGALFLPHDDAWRQRNHGHLRGGCRAGGHDSSRLARRADRQFDARRIREADRAGEQAGISSPATRRSTSDDEFERRLYILRKTISGTLYSKRERSTSNYYPVSLSCRTVIYKGMFLADQLGAYYPDLHDPDFESALALVHQRFSTNTFPAWSLAHPYRMIAHNGEINTLRGNNNWMAARQASVSSPKFGEDISQAVADFLRRPVRHRVFRQRARIPGDGRLFARPCDDDDDSGSLGRQSAR